MKKQLVMVAIVIVVLVIVLTSILIIFRNPENNDKNNNRFIGTWKNSAEDSTFIIHSNGTYEGVPGFSPITDHKGNWIVRGNSLRFYFGNSNDMLVAAFTFEFSNNDNTLTLTMENVVGDPVIYIYNKQ